MRSRPRTRRSGSPDSTKREARHPRAGRCRAPARADQRHGAARRRAADGGGAAHRPRQAHPVAARPRRCPTASGRWSSAAPGGRAGRLHHRPPRLLEHRASRRPRRARPAARQRGSDRLGDRAFRGHRRARADPRPRHRAGNAAARGARSLARGDAGSASTSRARRWLTRRPTRGGSASSRGSNGCRAIGPTDSRETFDLILCNPPYVADGAELGPGVARISSPTRPCSPARTGSTPIARSPRSFRACSRRAASPRSRSGFGQAEAVTELLARDGLQARVAADLAGRPRALLLTWV